MTSDSATASQPSGSTAKPIPLQGRWVTLRPVYPPDYQALYEMAISYQVGYRWRFRGAVPDFETFVQSLHGDVLSQFIVTKHDSPAPIGLVVCYCADLNNGTAYMAEMMAGQVATGLGVNAAAIFGHYLFSTWAFRKLYMEVPAYNLSQFESAIPEFLTIEGRLSDHLFYGDRYLDMVVLAAHRSRATKFSERYL